MARTSLIYQAFIGIILTLTAKLGW